MSDDDTRPTTSGNGPTGLPVAAQQAAFLADAQVPCASTRSVAPSASPHGGAGAVSWYLVTTEDLMIPPDAQRTMSERARSTAVEVAASHAVYVSQPDAVADLIKQAANASVPDPAREHATASA